MGTTLKSVRRNKIWCSMAQNYDFLNDRIVYIKKCPGNMILSAFTTKKQ